jgi:NAD(P)H-dependent FMN reductase
MLDSEYKNYQYKPVAFCGVSAGPWGGVRAIEALVPVTRTFGMVPIKKDVHFPYVQEIFNKEGELIEEELDKDYQKMVEEVYGELLKMGAVLKFGRQNIES